MLKTKKDTMKEGRHFVAGFLLCPRKKITHRNEKPYKNHIFAKVDRIVFVQPIGVF